MPKRPTQLAVAPRGRPAIHDGEPWDRITVVMLERHTAYLDLMSVLIRLKHHKAMSRAEIIRAFVEFMERSGIDFTQFPGADEMVVYLVDHFRRLPNRGRLPLLLESSLFHPERRDQRSRKAPNKKDEETLPYASSYL